MNMLTNDHHSILSFKKQKITNVFGLPIKISPNVVALWSWTKILQNSVQAVLGDVTDLRMKGMNKGFNEAHTASGVCLILRRNMTCHSQDPLSMCFQWLPPRCNWNGADATVTAREPQNTHLYRKNVPSPRRDASDVSCSQSSASGLSLRPASILSSTSLHGKMPPHHW